MNIIVWNDGIQFIPKPKTEKMLYKWTPDVLKTVLEGIPGKDQRHIWVRIIIGIKNVSLGFPVVGFKLAVEWSKKSDKYVEGCVLPIWNNQSVHQITDETLWYYCETKKDIQNKYYDDFCYNDIYKIKNINSVDKPTMFDDMGNFFNQIFIKICNDGYMLWYAKLRNSSGIHYKIIGHDLPLSSKSNNHTLQVEVDEIKSIKMIKILEEIQCTHIKHFDEAVFLPYIHNDPTNDNQFNIFQGYRQNYINNVQYEKLKLKLAKEIQIINDHKLNILCNNNKEFFSYLNNWLAANFQ